MKKYGEVLFKKHEIFNTEIATSYSSNKKSIEVLEKEFLQHEQVDCPVTHHFSPGVYTREVKLPAGTLAIGHHQNFEHLNIFIKGRVAMRNEDGSFTELKAPMVFVGKPGRKIGYIYEDVIWLNVYTTNETDIEKLESHFLTKSDAFTESMDVNHAILRLKANVDHDDFAKMAKEVGVTVDKIWEQSNETSDLAELPWSGYKIKVGDSHIHGKGLIATGNIEAGELIAPARISGKRTIAGRYTNHSICPNAKMVRGMDEDIDLVAIKNISGCKGGLNGEEITIDYRESVRLTLEIGGKKCLE
jgi:hypothetical protein